VDRGSIVAASSDSTLPVSKAVSDSVRSADIEPARANISAGGTETADLAIPTQPADRRATVRWLISAAFAITFHGIIATLMLQWQQPAGASVAAAEPILVVLTPVEQPSPPEPAAAPPAPPQQTQDTQDKPVENTLTPPVEEPIADKAEPVEPQQPQADENKPEQPQEMLPAEQQTPVIAEMEQKSEVELPAKQEAAKPVEKKKQGPKRVQSPPRAAKPETARPAAAAVPSAGSSDWRSQVIGILQRNKRYPPGADPNHELGTAHLAFTVDRRGRVISAHIAGSSGSAALDAETLALVHRVSFPPPPAEMAGAQITLSVSLEYKNPSY
jgi:periplasmic protein TonB